MGKRIAELAALLSLCCYNVNLETLTTLEFYSFIEKRNATLELEKLGKQYRKESEK